MATLINFPDAPTPGQRFVFNEITYQWMTEGYWKSVEASVGTAFPSEFCFYLNSVPATVLETLYRLDISSGQNFNPVTENAFGLIGNTPANDQIYDVYVNEVKATDTITVTAAGALVLSLPRAPYLGPATIKIRVSPDTIIDPLFDGFVLATEVYTT